MKKNVVVLVNEISSDYAQSILSGIREFYNKKDVNFIIVNSRIPSDKESRFFNPYYTGVKLSAAQDIDAVIILSSPYCSNLSIDEFVEYIKPVLKCSNVISISVPLEHKNTVYTAVTCKNVYKQIISHLHKEHGCSKIAFLGANATGSEEAMQRYSAFIEAMNDEGLEFTADHLFEGRFVYDFATESLKNRYKSKDDVDIDAIVAANDIMGLACIEYFTSLGLRVPEDIKIFGFDDMMQARLVKIPLSTINQNIKKQGFVAAELAYRKINGEKLPRKTEIEVAAVYRSSCGCSFSLEDLSDDDANSILSTHYSMHQYFKSFVQLQNIYFLLEAIKSEITLDSLFHSSFDELLPKDTIPSIAVCLFDSPVICNDEIPLSLPEKVNLVFYMNKDEDVVLYPNECFNTLKEMIPSRYFGKARGTFMIQPIFYARKQFGYFVCKINSSEYLFTLIYLKIFSSVISHAYIYTQQTMENKKLTTENIKLQLSNTILTEQSSMDELTNIFNRRGFIDAGQESINLALKMKMKGLVCFADMDNLKVINDSYGHEMGDKSLQLITEALQKGVRKNDVYGRLGGDEFAAVLPGMDEEGYYKLKAKIKHLMDTMIKERNLPFTISVSIGFVEFNEDNCDINELLKKADELQYIEKRKRHAGRQ